MVSNFKKCGDRNGAVFLGVQGGRTSEGVDFPGNQMNSVAVVGIPYAEPTPRVKAQIEYYDKYFPGLGREVRVCFARHEKSLSSRRKTNQNVRGPRSHSLFRLPLCCNFFLPRLPPRMDNKWNENVTQRKKCISKGNQQLL